MKDLRKFIATTIREYLNENQNSDNYLYHGTSLENVENIINNGFNEDTYWGDESTAEQYAYSYNEPVLIKIPKSEIINLIEPNSTLINFYEDNIDEDEDYKDIIDSWYNSTQTAKDSLDIFGSVILPPSNLNIDVNNIIKI